MKQIQSKMNKTSFHNSQIVNCNLGDLPAILDLYQAARELQTQQKMVVWPFFSHELITTELKELRQYKIPIEGEIAANWAITFSDKDIWEEKDQDDSIFIHRICVNPEFRGNRLIDQVVAWAKSYAKKQGRKYLRLDTLGKNDKLIKHYTSAGFRFLGIVRLSDTSALPKHYQDEPDCCLFEIEL